jgi:uncharacterized protein (TIGR01370 family)
MSFMMGPRAVISTCLVFVLIACSAGSAAAGPVASADSFAFGIGNHMLDGTATTVGNRFKDFGLVVVDGEEATPAEISAIQSHGVVVLGYLSVGTIEKWRGWYDQVKQYRLNADQNWRDEWFADTSRPGYRNAILNDIAPQLLGKGFDGLFLDNVDMIETRNHRAQRSGMRSLVGDLSDLAHSGADLLFAQNGAWILEKLDMVADLDGWNREDVTWTYDFDHRRYVRVGDHAHQEAIHELARFHDHFGLVTTATDYTARAHGKATRRSIRNACAVGALPYVSNINLTLERLPDPPLTCP